MTPEIARAPFGTTPDGRAVERYTLSNGRSMQVSVLTYGGIVHSVTVPDRRGHPADVLLGLPDLAAYVDHNPYLGCITGRFANRIARGRFTIDGVEHRLTTNEPPNHLHGGSVGFDKVVWSATELRDRSSVGLRLAHTSPDGDEGYPGTLQVEVDYVVSADDDSIRFEYRAWTDAPTIVNLTNHSLFNLAGEGTGDVFDHRLIINAGRYLPVDETQIPTGATEPVAGTPMDFRAPRAIGDRIDDPGFEQLRIGRGYDHTWVLDRDGPGLVPAALAVHPGTGRTLEVLTTEPGIQLYVGNRFDGTVRGSSGRPYDRGAGFALETQHFPDSPNHPAFPSTVLRPGERYESTTIYRFGVAA
jgi:aldose 1-epimerase